MSIINCDSFLEIDARMKFTNGIFQAFLSRSFNKIHLPIFIDVSDNFHEVSVFSADTEMCNDAFSLRSQHQTNDDQHIPACALRSRDPLFRHIRRMIKCPAGKIMRNRHTRQALY
ncbi:hypothetical protein [Pantoea phytobeneficialis]|uniref:Uncharacterized protein n=1 Tax=Pantoea phytobeneficialis TaxID=2052056 RepID=A0ABT8XWI1_9GAMM|nr:hypothetical protein [Pantoea phytobeneficialis]MDO6407507.1 hypothetical protein [Pantoea phytobeneficialis]